MDWEDVLFQKIVTRAKFGDAADEITFQAPVCLASLNLGAVPTFGQEHHHATINIFARDIRSIGSSRFACIYEGLVQPESGYVTAPLQGFVTNHIVIRGSYQTIPLSIHGYSLDHVADHFDKTQAQLHHEQYQSTTIPYDTAFRQFASLVSSLKTPTSQQLVLSLFSEDDTKRNRKNGRSNNRIIDFKKNAKPALDDALSYFKRVGVSPRKIAILPMSQHILKGIIRAADTVCTALSRLECDDALAHAIMDAASSSSQSSSSSSAVWLSECIDMAMGWTSLFADVDISKAICTPASKSTSMVSRQHVLDCARAGIASTLLLLFHPDAASSYISRYGVLILADMLRTANLPPTCMRHAMCACLVLMHSCGALGCEALLGWWKPLHVKWKDTTAKTASTGTSRGRVDDDDMKESRKSGDKRKSRHSTEHDSNAQGVTSHSIDGDGGSGDLRRMLDKRKEEKKRSSSTRSRSPPPLPAPTAEESVRESEYMYASSKYWDKRMKEFVGVYDAIAQSMMELQLNKELAVLGTHTMRVLQFYSTAAVFSNETEEVMYRLKDGKVMDIKKGMAIIERCAECMVDLASMLSSSMHRWNKNASLLLSSPDVDGVSHTSHEETKKNSQKTGSSSSSSSSCHTLLELPGEPSKLFVEFLESRRIVALIPALLTIPGAYEDHLTAQHGSAQTRAAMLSSISHACKEFVSVLMSSVRGLKLLSCVHEQSTSSEPFIERLEQSLMSAGCDDVAESIRSLVVASVAVNDLCFEDATMEDGTDTRSNKKRRGDAMEDDEGTMQGTATATNTPGSNAAGAVHIKQANDIWSSSQSVIAISTLASLVRDKNPSKRLPALFSLRLFSKIDLMVPVFARALTCVCDTLHLSSTGRHSLSFFDTGAVVDGDITYASEVLGVAWHKKNASYRISLDVVDILHTWLKEGHQGSIAPWQHYVTMHSPRDSKSENELLSHHNTSYNQDDVQNSDEKERDIVWIVDSLVQGLHGQPLPRRASSLLNALEHLRGCLHALSGKKEIRKNGDGLGEENKKERSKEMGLMNYIMSIMSSHLPSFVHVPVGADQATREHAQRTNWNAVREFWDSPFNQGQTETALKIMTCLLWQKNGRQHAIDAYHHDGLYIVTRAVQSAKELLVAAHADRKWVHRVGAAIDPASSSRYRSAALEFLFTAAAAAHSFLQHLRTLLPVSSAACLNALLDAHAELCIDDECILFMKEGSSLGNEGSVALAARRQLVGALRCWIEAPDILAATLPPAFSPSSPPSSSPYVRGWSPSLFATLLTGPYDQEALSPLQLFTACCLLGDLFPEEWPLPGRQSSQTPPSVRKYRLLLAQAIETSQDKFKNLLAGCTMSESVFVRAATVRCMARASGLGGGMGIFVLEPVVKSLEEAVSLASAGSQAHDSRKALEMLVPLVYRPALKAAMLDSTVPMYLARILSIMIAGSAPTTTGMPSILDRFEAQSQCTMVMECLLALCNIDICLDPIISREQAAAEETLSVVQATAVSAALLEHLPALGANIPLANDVIKLLSKTASGRIALRHAAAALHHAAAGQQMPPELRPEHAIAGAQYVANKYWTMASSVKDNPAMASVYQTFEDVCTVMKDICTTIDGDAAPGASAPAPMRFAVAAQAAVAKRSADRRRGRERDGDVRWECPGTSSSSFAGVLALCHCDGRTTDVFDPVTRVFWRNHMARSVPQTPASTAASLRRYYRKECAFDRGLAVVTTLHAPLSHPTRPMDEDMIYGNDGVALILDALQQQQQVEEEIERIKGEEDGSIVAKEERIVKEEGRENVEEAAAAAMAAVVNVVLPMSIEPQQDAGAVEFDLYADLMDAPSMPAQEKQLSHGVGNDEEQAGEQPQAEDAGVLVSFSDDEL